MNGPESACSTTPPAEAWRGDFGTDYTARQAREPSQLRRARNVAFFARALQGLNVRSVLEFGAGAGDNLRALQVLYPMARMHGVEINEGAADLITGAYAHRGDVLDDRPELDGCGPFDLALTKGFLIHMPPERIDQMYARITHLASRWILMAEYFSPYREERRYRDREGMMWRAPFWEEMNSRHGCALNLRLVAYGFAARADFHWQDDLTWWLIEKGAA